MKFRRTPIDPNWNSIRVRIASCPQLGNRAESAKTFRGGRTRLLCVPNFIFEFNSPLATGCALRTIARVFSSWVGEFFRTLSFGLSIGSHNRRALGKWLAASTDRNAKRVSTRRLVTSNRLVWSSKRSSPFQRGRFETPESVGNPDTTCDRRGPGTVTPVPISLSN